MRSNGIMCCQVSKEILAETEREVGGNKEISKNPGQDLGESEILQREATQEQSRSVNHMVVNYMAIRNQAHHH